MPYLEIIAADGPPLRHPIVRRLTTIGTSPECHIVLQGPDIGSTHATLSHEPGRFKLESTRRAHPFMISGKKLRTRELQHGDAFAIGAIELVFSALEEPRAESVPSRGGHDDAIQLEAMRSLLSFSRQLAEFNDLAGLLDELIDHVVALTRASKGFLVLARGDDNYEVRVGRNFQRQTIPDPNQLLSDDIIREVIASRRSQIISDALADTRFQNSLSVMKLELSSVMCVPMIVRGQLLGIIYVGNDNVVDLFTPPQLETLEVFASQAALFVNTAQSLVELRRESADLSERLERVKFGSIVGTCPQMVEIYKRVEKVAVTDITVLINGETGTGKELIARELHNRSSRSAGPFITVNCGAIPENLIESELFGHIKGAFTGATDNRIGKFQAAHGGTIFLDEIGELPLALQVKLLRVLQERQVQRVGSTTSTEVDMRIVAATNRQLDREVEAGRFREDLYFRLNVIGIELPPLRERGDDIITIARYLVGRHAADYGLDFDPSHCFDSSAIRAMLQFRWPGNIRQLENHIKKALVLAESQQLRASDLDLELPEGSSANDEILPLNDAREFWQRQYINRVLAMHNGNRTKAAKALGVDPRTVFRHLEKEEKIRRGEA